MTLFAVTNGVVTSYVYNSDGVRTQKIHYDENAEYVGVTKYTLDGNKIVAENRLGTNIYYTYDDKGSIMGMVYGGESYVFAKNLQGDVIGIYDSDSVLVAKYEYSAFGEIISVTDLNGSDIANINPFRYRGYYYDAETGFYYLNSRYYDPVVGRFLNADAILGANGGIIGYNMFVYCSNEPINKKDANGMCYTPNDIEACLRGADCCDHNHTSSDYLSACLTYSSAVALPFRDVTSEFGNALYKASVMASDLRVFVNQMNWAFRAGGELGIYVTFYAFVNHNALWDIKTKASWERTIGTPFPGYNMPVIFCGMIMTPESLGNFAYGFLGAAYGIPYNMLIAGSYYAAGLPSQGAAIGNEITDEKYILMGYYFGFGMFGN